MYNAIAANKRNTVLIMPVFVALITGIGYVVSLFFGDTSITWWVLGGVLIYARRSSYEQNHSSQTALVHEG